MSVLDEFKLDGQVAVVTGGGRGIGEGIALGLAEAGADVVLAARRAEEIEAVAEKVRALGRRALAVPADVMQIEQVQACLLYTSLRETTLRNAGAIAITVVGTEVRVGAHCWRGLANVCIDDAASLGGELQASGRLDELTLARLHPWMPEGFAPQGEVTGSWRVSQQDAAWQAQAEVEVARFELLYEGQQLNLDSIEVELVASPASVELRFAGDAAALRVRGTAQALGLDENAQLTAQADLDLNISESPLQIAGVKRAEGALSANLSVDGTLGQPEFAMSGTWQNGSIRLLDPELELIEIDTRWETTSAGWKIEGQAKPPEGGRCV